MIQGKLNSKRLEQLVITIKNNRLQKINDKFKSCDYNNSKRLREENEKQESAADNGNAVHHDFCYTPHYHLLVRRDMGNKAFYINKESGCSASSCQGH